MLLILRRLAKSSLVISLLIFPVLLMAETSVSGQIVDEDGKPLDKALIRVEWTSIKTHTDGEGNFSLNVPFGDAVLIISRKGYKSREIGLDFHTSVTIMLEKDIPVREEFVQLAYQPQRKKDKSQAISGLSVNGSRATAFGGLEQAIQYQIPGLMTIAEGGPGGVSKLRMRGFATLHNNDPLYVIDGIPVPAGLNHINPGDVEDIHFLKDASAAIYGMRGANGVVLINTKQGRKNKLSFEAFTGIQSQPSFPQMLNPAQMADWTWDALRNAGQPLSHPQYGQDSVPVLPFYILPNGVAEGGIDENDYDAEDPNKRFVRANQEGTQWMQEIFQPAIIQNYHLQASGTQFNSSYFFSFNYFNQKGTLLNTCFDRYSVRSNVSRKATDRFTVGENFSLSYTKKVGLPGGNQHYDNSISMAYRMPSIIPVYDIRGNFAGTRGEGLGNAYNPVAMQVRNRDNYLQSLRALGNVFAEVEITDRLKAKSLFGVDVYSLTGKNYQYIDIENLEPAASNSLSMEQGLGLNWIFSNTLQYQIKFKKHKVDAIAGVEWMDNRYQHFGTSRTDFFSDHPSFQFFNAGQGDTDNWGWAQESAMMSSFAKVNYQAYDRYLFSASIRRDASSLLGANSRSGIFPSFSLGWRMSEERFMRKQKFFSDLLLRGSWGEMGILPHMNNTAFSSYASNLFTTSYDLGGTNNSVYMGLDKSHLANPNLSFEKITSEGLGIDAAMVKGRMILSVDIWRQMTDGMLVPVQPPLTQGISDPIYRNVGQMSNQGYDLSLRYANKSGNPFRYDFNVVISQYKNELLGLGDSLNFLEGAEGRTYHTTRTEAGQPLSAYYGYIVEGVFQTQEEVANHAVQNDAAPGRFKYQDINEDGRITEEDQTFLGSPHPDFIFGFNGMLSFMNIDLRFFVQGVRGNEIFNYSRYFTDFNTLPGNKSVRVLDAWSPENPIGSVPAASHHVPNHENEPSSYFIEDGSYTRLKFVELGYTFPDYTLKRMGLSSLRVYVSGQNLYTKTAYQGLDPETASFPGRMGGLQSDMGWGTDFGSYPLPKTMLLGFNIGL